MLGLTRRDRAPDPAHVDRMQLKPAIYEPPGARTRGAPAGSRPTGGAPLDPLPGAAVAPSQEVTPVPARPATGGSPAPDGATPHSRLAVGVDIRLKGMEISNCASLSIEGRVEATVHGTAMEILAPGMLLGVAHVDVAEIHGEFSGELTARTRLVIHATGRVTGTIRYGRLVVEEGGALDGDVHRIDATDAQAPLLHDLGAVRAAPVAPLQRDPS